MDRNKLHVGFILLLALAVTALFLRMIQGFLLALLLGAIFAGLAYPTYRRLLAALRGRTGLAAGLTLLLGIVLVLVPAMVLSTVVAREARQISHEVRPWIDRQVAQSEQWEERLETVPGLESVADYQDDIVAKLGELGGKAAAFAVNSLAAGTRGTARFFLLLFVMLYALFYFLREGRSLLERALRHVPLEDAEKTRVLTTFTTVTRATLKGTGVIGIVQGALGGLAFAVVGITGPVFWATLMAILSIIPGIGPTLIWVPAVVYLALEGKMAAAIGLALWCALVVSTIDNLLRPVLVGKDTKMPDLLVLLGTLGGLVMFGAVGIIVGPIIAALFLTVWELFGAAVDQGSPLEAEAGTQS